MFYECKPSQLPEDVIPDKFTLENGRRVSPYVRIGRTKDDLFKQLSPHICRNIHFIARRVGTKNKGRYTWCGEHPLYWKEI